MRLLGLAFVVAWSCVAVHTVYAQQTAPAAVAPAGAAAPAVDAKNATSVGSYGIGMNVARGLKSDGLDVDVDAFVQGLRDALQGAQPRYNAEQLRAAFTVIAREAQAKKEQKNQSLSGKNKTEGEAFLAANKGKPGVTTTPSGLQYQVLKTGTGPSPKASDTVKVHYEGTLLDGKIFDSSIKRNEPAVFPVNGVIAGWTEALQLMKVGDRWRLFIPSKLAYGEHGTGEDIGPNAVLTFEVELLDIQPTPGQ
jgi:FKBP-type peptidyl-prolyl cis-trans isomerase FklB